MAGILLNDSGYLYGGEPSANKVKKNHITRIRTFLLIFISAIGLLLQLTAMITTKLFPSNKYSINFYILFTFGTVIFAFLMITFVMKISNLISKKWWLPQLINQYKSTFEDNKFIINHDGIEKRRYDSNDTVSNSDKKGCYEYAVQFIDRLIDEFEIKTNAKTEKDKLVILENLFNKYK